MPKVNLTTDTDKAAFNAAKDQALADLGTITGTGSAQQVPLDTLQKAETAIVGISEIIEKLIKAIDRFVS